jgi:type VI secretion system secreted protein VgrG
VDNIIVTTVIIGGSLKLSDKKFSYLSVTSSMNNHHSVQLQLPLSNLNGLTIEGMMKYIGKDILIESKYKNKDIPGTFKYKGIVTAINYSNDSSFDPSVSITGTDASILLDDHEKCESFLDKSLDDIIKKVTSDYGQVQLKSSPSYTKNINYCVQYRETPYNFINRLSSKYGQWFYFDGEELIFGKKEAGSKYDLILGGNLSHFAFSLNSIPLKDNSKTNNYIDDDVYESKSQHKTISSLDTRLAETVKEQSEKLFPIEGNDFYSPKYTSKTEFEENEKTYKGVLSSGLFLMSGSSSCLGLQLGSVVDIYSSSKTPDIRNIKDKEGSFLITSITHSLNNDGTYYNSFSGIPDKNIHPQLLLSGNNSNATPQIAKVVDNKDEKKLGRIKVRFSWMDKSESTPWIRISHVHASKNRGFYFIPEIDDEVLVDFESGDPDCPIVIGSLYNGKSSPDEWYDDPNEIKAIRTKSGNEIIINDKSGNEMIEIANPKGKNKIIITMAENNKIKIISDGDIEMTAENKISLKSKQIEFTADNELDMKSQKWTSKSTQAKITSDTSIDIEGGTSAKLKGSASLDLEGGGTANLKAALVKIN